MSELATRDATLKAAWTIYRERGPLLHRRGLDPLESGLPQDPKRRIFIRGSMAIMVVRWLVVVVVALACGCSGDEGDDDGGNPSGVGNYCEVDADCETDDCYIGPGGGYCTTACSDEGSESQCPLDTVCKPIQGGARRCLLICGSDSACDIGDCGVDYCPSGSSCVSVSNTTHQACEPEPS